MGMIDEGRWDPEPSVVGAASVHRRPPAEPVDQQLALIADEVVRAHQGGTCARCWKDTCEALAWAWGWQTGDRQPYPA